MERGDQALRMLSLPHPLPSPTGKIVVVRLDRTIQYCRAPIAELPRSGILGHPLSRVVTAGFVER
jgi:hypothetical protein